MRHFLWGGVLHKLSVDWVHSGCLIVVGTMEHGNTIEVRKISEWNRLLNVKTKDIFHGLLGVVEGIMNLEAGTATRAGVEMLLGIGSEMNDELPQRAYVLMYGAIRQGMVLLVTDSAHLIREYNRVSYEAFVFQQMADSLDMAFEENTIEIDESFFDKPDQHKLFLLVQPIFRAWLLGINLPEHVANSIANRLDFYYVRKLDELLAAKPEYFAELKQKLERSPAQRRVWARYLYDQRIIAEWKAGIFQESFGLSEIHVPLPACYPVGKPKKDWKDQRQHRVTNAEDHVWNWLQRPYDPKAPTFRILVLRGGPGSGKSSMMKKIAWRLAQQAEQSKRPFYFISLVSFEVELGIKKAIEDYIQNDEYLRGLENPCDPDLAGGNLKPIFIFDGLDELSRSGKSGEQTARELVAGIQDYLRDHSDQTGVCDFRAIITGRDLIVQQVTELGFHEEGQILELLPMFLAKKEDDWRSYEFEDPSKLLEKDLRPVWWTQFWKVKDPTQQQMPQVLAQDEYESLSCQPLLSYLLARAYLKGDLNQGLRHNTNSVYESLVRDVCLREWGVHKHTDLHPDQYKLLLQALALTAWQGGDVRATTIANFEKQCLRPELKALMEQFRIKREASPTDLMTSFFTRKLGKDEDQDALIEFTHKSFGEYLVALEFLVVMEDVADEYRRGKMHSKTDAIRAWMEAFSLSEITEYIWDFLARQLRLAYGEEQGKAERLQITLAALFSDLIHEGFPVAAYQTSLQVEAASRIAQTNLLLILSAFSLVTDKSTIVAWNEDDQAEARNVLSVLLRGGGGLLLRRGLNRLSIPQRMDSLAIHAVGADLEDANLSGASLIEASLSYAVLSGANLSEADLSEADLSGADLSGAYLRGADLSGANLSGANLGEADLRGADLREADLGRAKLIEADLRGANLIDVFLSGANLSSAKVYPICIDFEEDLVDGQEAYDYLISQGATNVPKPEGLE